MIQAVLGERYRLGERIAGGGMGVEGETLAERIAATGRLPFTEAFALGEQVARALTPYAGANRVAIATRHVSSPVPDPRSDLTDLPAPAADLIRRALAKHPADRFPSAMAPADAVATAATQDHGPQDAGAGQGAREPHPPLSGPPEGERSPVAGGVPLAVHRPGRAGGRWWRWGSSS
jgi:hypothetical protein